jgi:6-phosphogluconate dehydrogenase
MQIGVIGLGRMGGNITRRLMENSHQVVVYDHDPNADSGEGRWTVMAAVEEAVPADVLSAALYTRFRSRRDHTLAEEILSAVRKGFGAHVEPKDHKAKPS